VARDRTVADLLFAASQHQTAHDALDLALPKAELLDPLARVMIEQGHPQEALRMLSQLLQNDPQHASLLLSRAAALKQLGDHTAALRDLEAAAALQPDDAKALCRLGDAYRTAKKFVEAVRTYERALALDPELLQRVKKAAERMPPIEDVEALRSLLQRIEHEQHSKDEGAIDPDLLLKRARKVVTHGDFDRARALLEQFLLREPDHAEARMYLDRLLDQEAVRDAAQADLPKEGGETKGKHVIR
jgi:tetratricopeptide (TPR) repeat protein